MGELGTGGRNKEERHIEESIPTARKSCHSLLAMQLVGDLSVPTTPQGGE